MQRFAAFRIHQSLVQKPLKLEAFWPLEGDKKEEEGMVWGSTPEEAKAMYEAVKKAHKMQ